MPSDIEKQLSRIRIFDKAILLSSNAAIRENAKRHKAYSLKKIVVALATKSELRSASCYAREALMLGFTWKWLLYSSYLTFKSMVKR